MEKFTELKLKLFLIDMFRIIIWRDIDFVYSCTVVVSTEVVYLFPSCTQFDTGRWPSSINCSFIHSFFLPPPPLPFLCVCVPVSFGISVGYTD